MRRAGLSFLLTTLLLSPNSFACGDKYVVFGQGVRFQRAYAAAHPAAILVYLKPGTKAATEDNRDRLLTVLRMVGHRPDAITSADELHIAVASNKYDIILTEPASAPEATASLKAARVHPTVVPMVFDPTSKELAAVEKENRCAVAVSKRSHELLNVINTVMNQRMKGIEDACRTNV